MSHDVIWISHVTYLLADPGPMPGWTVPYAVAPNRVMDAENRVLDLNVANLLGIKAWPDSLHANRGLIGDTLRVFVDLTALKEPPAGVDWTKLDAIKATIDCVLMAAAGSRRAWIQADDRVTDATWVDLRILGPSPYANLGGVFGLEFLRSLPRSRMYPPQ